MCFKYYSLVSLSIILIFLLSGCIPQDIEISRPEPPNLLTILTNPDIVSIDEALNVCASKSEGFIISNSTGSDQENHFDIKIEYYTKEFGSEVYLLATDELMLVGTADLRSKEFTLEEIQNLFSGLNNFDGNNSNLWSYPDKHPYRQKFFDALSIDLQNSRTYLVSDAESMFNAISTQQNGIGYLPKSWFSPGLSQFILGKPANNDLDLSLQIVAEVADIANPHVYTMIDCLQNGEGHAILRATFPNSNP